VGTQAGDLGCDRHGQCVRREGRLPSTWRPELGVPMSSVRGGVVAQGPSFGHGESGWIQGSPVQLNHVHGPTNTEWCRRSGGRIALSVDDKLVGLESKRLQWKMIE